jgi:hypothetical protein
VISEIIRQPWLISLLNTVNPGYFLKSKIAE